MKTIIKKIVLVGTISFLFCSLILGFSHGRNGVNTYPMPLGTASPENTATHVFAESFAKEVNRLSDGKMRIQVYPNSTVGGDMELLESCKNGDIPFVIQTTAPQVSYIPELAIFDLPFLFDNIEQARKVVDNQEFYQMIEKLYRQSGFKSLGFSDQGFRVTSANKEFNSLEDIKGLKIRTMENPNHINTWRSIGANPTPTSFSEVYVGLQQGIIDAQENPYNVIVSSKLYEQQDYIIETNHLPHYLSLIVNNDFFEKLEDREKQIIQEAATIAKEAARQDTNKKISTNIEEITKSGTKIVQLSPQLKEEIKSRLQEVNNQIKKQAGEELYQAYTK